MKIVILSLLVLNFNRCVYDFKNDIPALGEAHVYNYDSIWVFYRFILDSLEEQSVVATPNEVCA